MPGEVRYPVSMYPTGSPFKQPGDISGGMGGGGGGLLSAMFPPQINQPQVSTGTDAQGNPTFDVTPASVGGGFMNRLIAGRQGQMQVNSINAAMQEERMRQLGNLMAIREQGKQSRETISSSQVTDILKQHGLIDTPENRDYINKEFSAVQQRIEQAKAANLLQTEQSPAGQKAMTDSNLGNMMLPAFAAQKASEVSATPGETVAYNNANNLTASTPDVLRGATATSTQSTPMQVPKYDANGKITGFGVQTFPTGQTSMQPGGLQQAIDPAILQQASQLQAPPVMGGMQQQNDPLANVLMNTPGFSNPSTTNNANPQALPNPNPGPPSMQDRINALGKDASIGDFFNALMGINNQNLPTNNVPLTDPRFGGSPVY